MRWRARIGETSHDVEITRRADGTVAASVDGRPYSLSLREPQPLVYSILMADGASHEAIIQQKPGTSRVRVDGTPFEIVADDGAGAGLSGGAGRRAAGCQSKVTAIMPGRVVRLLVKQGDKVAARQGLLVVEAMKMENEIAAPRDGVVKQLLVAAGKPVESGETLLVLE
jgi:biotin carboxyl carrier protein